MVDVRHERPMDGLEFRVRAPLQLELQSGERIVVQEWSQSGITYPVETDVLPKKGFLTIPFQGVDIRFAVAFTKGDGPHELLFKNLNGRQREIIGVFYRSILSGKMASANEMITSLDTPVDLVPMGETEEETANATAKARPRVLRVVWNVVFYLMLASVLAFLIGGQIWNRLSSVNLSNGRIIAPALDHRAVEAAYVDSILVVPGETVRRGQTLVKLSNPKLDGALDDVRRDIVRAGKDIRKARDVWQAHQQNRAKARAALLAEHENTLSQHVPDDFFAGRDVSDVTELWRRLSHFDAGTSDEIGDFQDISSKLKDRLNDAKELERRLKRDLSNAKSFARSGDIVAAADGIIAEIHVFQNEYLARGKTALTLEENQPRFVQAWVNEARADAIYVGMETLISFRNAQGKRELTGTISNITAGVDPDTDNGFGMIVSIALPEFDLAASRQRLRQNAPVKVRALKDWHRFLRFF